MPSASLVARRSERSPACDHSKDEGGPKDRGSTGWDVKEVYLLTYSGDEFYPVLKILTAAQSDTRVRPNYCWMLNF